MMGKKISGAGFTLVEVVVASAVFLTIALSLYQGFVSISNLAVASRQKMAAVALANEQLEMIRNLAYSDIGLISGFTPGKLPEQKTEVRNGLSFVVTTQVRGIDDSFDGTINTTPKDDNPVDYKYVEVQIDCPTCRNFSPVALYTTVAPKNLESDSNSGALFIRVLDSNGLPVAGANVKITNSSSTISVNDVTNNSGWLQLVDVPPGNIAYQIVVSKSGYSSSRTYSPNESNLPNPYLPDATVATGQVTQVSFIIEHLSNLTIKTVDSKCQPIGSFTFDIFGDKLIGTNPPTLAYQTTKTSNEAGLASLLGLVWDNYHFTPQDASYTIAGSLPPLPVNLPAGTDLAVSLVLSTLNPKGLVVNVKDAATGLPISGATVKIVSPFGDSSTGFTSRGFISQTDWSDGGDNLDSNIEINDPAGEIKLKSLLGAYSSSGTIISRVFDTGSASSTYYALNWQPGSQATSTGEGSIKFQLATSEDSATTTWNFAGPDGSSSTYYTVSGSTISATDSYHRYIRYKLIMSTADTGSTPNISDVSIAYGSDCLPAGQVYFGGLTASSYEVNITKDGYQDYYGTASSTADWQVYETTINPL